MKTHPIKGKEDIKEIREYLTKIVNLPYERYKTFDTLNDDQIILLFEFSDYLYGVGRRDGIMHGFLKPHPEDYNEDLLNFSDITGEWDEDEWDEDEWDEDEWDD